MGFMRREREGSLSFEGQRQGGRKEGRAQGAHMLVNILSCELRVLCVEKGRRGGRDQGRGRAAKRCLDHRIELGFCPATMASESL